MATSERKKAELIVSGFVREIQEMLPKNDNFFMIPREITNECIKYYLIREYFATLCKWTKTSDRETTIVRTNTGGTYSTGINFGAVSIPSTEPIIYRWYIKINHGGPKYAKIIIGISSDPITNIVNNRQNVFDSYYSNRSNYGWNGFSGSKYGDGGYSSYADTFGDDDMICMELNLRNKRLRYSVNEQDQGIAFYDIKTGDHIFYRLAVFLGHYQDSVTIQRFKCF